MLSNLNLPLFLLLWTDAVEPVIHGARCVADDPQLVVLPLDQKWGRSTEDTECGNQPISRHYSLTPLAYPKG